MESIQPVELMLITQYGVLHSCHLTSPPLRRVGYVDLDRPSYGQLMLVTVRGGCTRYHSTSRAVQGRILSRTSTVLDCEYRYVPDD
jgi:hypothetical protein